VKVKAFLERSRPPPARASRVILGLFGRPAQASCCLSACDLPAGRQAWRTGRRPPASAMLGIACIGRLALRRLAAPRQANNSPWQKSSGFNRLQSRLAASGCTGDCTEAKACFDRPNRFAVGDPGSANCFDGARRLLARFRADLPAAGRPVCVRRTGRRILSPGLLITRDALSDAGASSRNGDGAPRHRLTGRGGRPQADRSGRSTGELTVPARQTETRT